MMLGYRKDLQEDDLYQLITSKNESETLGNRLQLEWKKELGKLNGTPSLTRALARAFKRGFLFIALPVFLEECIFKYSIQFLVKRNDGMLFT